MYDEILSMSDENKTNAGPPADGTSRQPVASDFLRDARSGRMPGAFLMLLEDQGVKS